jgi:hypothetical protein
MTSVVNRQSHQMYFEFSRTKVSALQFGRTAPDLRAKPRTLLLGNVYPGSWHVGAVDALQAI